MKKDDIVVFGGCGHSQEAECGSKCEHCDLYFCGSTCFDKHECGGHKGQKECEACGEFDETVVESKENGIPFRVCRSCYTDEIHNQAQKWGSHV